jgi:hypothetical protein
MQMKNQGKIPKKWKIVAGIGTAAALGVTGIAFAGSGGVAGVPAPITLQSQAGTSESLSPTTTWQLTEATGETWLLDLDTTLPVTANAEKAPSASPGTTYRMMRTTGGDDMGYFLGDLSPDSPDVTVDSPDVTVDSPDVTVDSPDVTVDDSIDSVDYSIDSVDSSIDS